MKARNWSITINNPTDTDDQQVALLSGLHWVKEVQGQKEQGKEGTLHYQLFLKTDNVRFSQVKKALPRAHIEIAKNVNALRNYVVKEETRVQKLPQIKVATQGDLQKRLYRNTHREALDWCNSFCGSVRYYEGDTLYEHHYQKYLTWLEEENIKNKDIIESKVDGAVCELIKEGYYGIEFVMANNLVRSAFKKYFTSIMYREHASIVQAQRQEDHEETDDEEKAI